MSNKKKNARIKRQMEEESRKQEEKEDRRSGTPFTNISTGIIFIITGFACAACFIAFAIYQENSGWKIFNLIILAIMAVYFFWKAPAYLRQGKALRKQK